MPAVREPRARRLPPASAQDRSDEAQGRLGPRISRSRHSKKGTLAGQIALARRAWASADSGSSSTAFSSASACISALSIGVWRRPQRASMSAELIGALLESAAPIWSCTQRSPTTFAITIWNRRQAWLCAAPSSAFRLRSVPASAELKLRPTPYAVQGPANDRTSSRPTGRQPGTERANFVALLDGLEPRRLASLPRAQGSPLLCALTRPARVARQPAAAHEASLDAKPSMPSPLCQALDAKPSM